MKYTEITYITLITYIYIHIKTIAFSVPPNTKLLPSLPTPSPVFKDAQRTIQGTK